ncbi:hypothetical protein [Candidatus Enterococcus huntleyi]|uniref:hypothetical protein n=1 Tax=Candidatus Enterococcus huntleyi TaxID=1857217 RepID=UPI00137B7357|nr:hypothetical protein [Enterococcus sp. JM4C]
MGGLGVLVYRYLVYSRLNQIKDIENYPVIFQRKLNHVKQQEVEKHVLYLLILAFLLLMSVSIGIFSTYQLTQASSVSKNEIQQLKERVEQLENQAQSLESPKQVSNEEQDLENLVLSDESLNLADYPWQIIFDDENQNIQSKSEQNKMESNLSKELKDYFQVDTVEVILEANQTMSLKLTKQQQAIASENEQLLEKITRFVKEAEAIPGLNQIAVTAEGLIKEDDTSSSLYSRESNQESFKEQRDNTSKIKEGKM